MPAMMIVNGVLQLAVLAVAVYGIWEALKMRRFLKAMRKQREEQKELDAILSNPHRPGFHAELEEFLKRKEARK